MKKINLYVIILGCVMALSSCWEDRSWQYYEKIQTKSWMYETMQKNYLFYEDLPALKSNDKIFFKQPTDFLRSVASKKDGKAGYIFSHIDSVRTETRSMSDYPGFGYEAAFVNVRFESQLVPALRVLYVQKDSPAYRSGIKRGDWIIAVDSIGVKSEKMAEYTFMPSGPHEFMMAEINAEQSGFDTLEASKVLTPEPVLVNNILSDGVVNTEGGHKAYYILYNEFGDDVEEWDALFGRMAATQFDDVIVDLRYNPGGYLSTLQYMASRLVPAGHAGENFVQLLPAEGLGLQPKQYVFDESTPLAYRNLYVIATMHSASASEAFINCLRPYMNGHMYHVGTNTYGKNMAQSRFVDDKQAPGLEFWLTTYYVANIDNEYDYFTGGLKPDYLKAENLGGALGEMGTPADSLMQPVLYHMDNNQFESALSADARTIEKRMAIRWEEIGNTVANRRKRLLDE